MKIVLSKPRIIEYFNHEKSEIAVKWDNADGVACTGFMNTFKDRDIEFEWLQCINRQLSPEELEEFSKNAAEKLSTADALIRVGSPAWFNESDLAVYKQCIDHDIPFSLMSIGVGCKWDKEDWHIFRLKENTLIDIAESKQLKLISCRDPNCYSLFSKSIPQRIDINPCLGYLCLPSDIKTQKDRVIIEVLDYLVLKNNAQFPEEEINQYYKEIKKTIEFFESRTNVTLMLQRPIFDSVQNIIGPQIVPIETMDDENRWVWEKYFQWREPVFCATYEDFETLFASNDVLITGRVHGALPAAGNGLACFGLGIDMRQFTWSFVPTIKRKDIRYMKPFSEEIKQWWQELDIERISEHQMKIRTATEIRYNEQLDYMIGNKRSGKKVILPIEIENAYIEEEKRTNKNLSDTTNFDEDAESVLSKFSNPILINCSLDKMSDEKISDEITKLTEEYDFVFLLSEKDIQWWDNFIKTLEGIESNAELSNSFRKTIGQKYSKKLSVFYCLEKK